MKSTRASWLLGAALAVACDRSGSEAPAQAADPPAAKLSSPPLVSAAPPASTTPAAQIERASIVAFVHRGAQLQNTGELLAHAALFAPGFAGSERAGALTTPFDLGSFFSWTQMITLTAGAIVLMWLGELITEKGIGNGISFIIFAGIVSQAPAGIINFLGNPDPGLLVAVVLIGVLSVGVIVYIQEGQRRIPIQYAARMRGRRMYQGGQTFLPLRVNLAGVIPIIFALSILSFPALLASYFQNSDVEIVQNISIGIVSFFSQNTIQYAIMYFLLTVGFTYFYTAFTFKPDETAESLRKNGGFIPGIRPGRPTQDYLARVVSRITAAGALFLGIVAVVPVLAGIVAPSLGGIAFGGTGILIVVSVVVETLKQIEAQLLMRNYEGFIR
jgi:preprotein translocase subunit SecY